MLTRLRELVDLPTAEIARAARDESLSPLIHSYAQVLNFYLQGDLERLTKTEKTLEKTDLPEKELLLAITKLRVRIRQRDLKKSDTQQLESQPLADVFEAEKFFCLGIAHETLGDDENAARCFRKASTLYRDLGCPQKSLRALFNTVSAESRVFPHKTFIGDYQALIDLAEKSGDRIQAGMAKVMISREYQIGGMSAKALDLVQQAIKDVQSERGCTHFYHALLQKAHVLIDLKKETEALDLLKEIALAPFPDVQAAGKLLLAAVDPAAVWDPRLEKDLLPTWRKRIPELVSRLRVGHDSAATGLEERLLKLAYNGPIAKWDLIEKLYPGENSSDLLENRFKNLTARVRKKYPGLLECQNGRYSVNRLPMQ